MITSAIPPLPALFGTLAEARGVLLAISGGPDSTALMHLAAAWRPAGLPMWVATVDHGLRPEARGDAEAVIEAAVRLDLPASLLTWDAPKPQHRLQERAREVRYDLLLGYARQVGASHLVTAHTLDDQAETLLMRLAAGSGPAGLAGMRPLSRRGGQVLARPFLDIRKTALVSLCRECGWSFIDDPANDDPRFDRARWRRLAPALAAEGLTPERLGHLAARLARADAALDLCAVKAARDSTADAIGPARCFAASLLDQPDELVLRVLQAALRALAPQAPSRLGRLERLLAAIRVAQLEGRSLRRTLQGCTVTFDAANRLTLRAEPRRLRGKSPDELRSLDPDFSFSLNAKP